MYIRNSHEVVVSSIDTSGDTPTIFQTSKLCATAQINQQQAIAHIMNHWTTENNFNTKVILFGERGLGKTYVAKLLKKHIEATYVGTWPLLFDDFNPSTIALNVNTMVLKQAEPSTPVILVVNEIDSIFEKVCSGPEPFDHRLQHTRNRQEFHNMLDNIGDKKHVITIYTMESNPVDLFENPYYKSFMRKGRIDFFIEMTSKTATILRHPR
jgi:ATP-dependent 26S proteasome regulatory subunit